MCFQSASVLQPCGCDGCRINLDRWRRRSSAPSTTDKAGTKLLVVVVVVEDDDGDRGDKANDNDDLLEEFEVDLDADRMSNDEADDDEIDLDDGTDDDNKVGRPSALRLNDGVSSSSFVAVPLPPLVTACRVPPGPKMPSSASHSPCIVVVVLVVILDLARSAPRRSCCSAFAHTAPRRRLLPPARRGRSAACAACPSARHRRWTAAR